MRPAANPDELLASPVGRYLLGRSWVAWVYSETLAGVSYFGRPDETERAMVERLFEMPAHPALKSPCDVLVDCGGLEAMPPWAFEFTARYIEVARPSANRFGRVAVVRPPGHAGIVLAGVFYEMLRDTYVAALFADRHEALVWLQRDEVQRASQELDEVIDAARGTLPELRRLRLLLERDHVQPSLQRIARALGSSPRSLQRMLSAAHTTFRRQVEHARLRAAERLLADDFLKLEAVAREVGYAKLAHFTAAFCRATGESPAEFRLRRQPK